MWGWLLHESPGEYVWGEVETPVPGPGEVRIKVMASALNHIDLWLTRGMPKPRAFPHVSGSDVSGVIDAVGAGVTDWSPGDEVVMEATVTSHRAILEMGIDNVMDPEMMLLGEHCWGGHAEYVVVPAWHPLPKPPSLSWVECAAYPVAYVTAWRMLRKARAEAGSTVLVVGVGGGVATAALLMANHIGCRVYATSRDEAKRRRAIELGAIDAFDSTGRFPVKADIVIDSVGAATWESSMRALANGGRYVTCGGTSGIEVPLTLPRIFFKHQEIIGVTTGSHQEFVKVTELVENGLPVIVDEVYPMAGYADAVMKLSKGDQLGKLVLDHTQ
ncbi:MAG TPA: zinc-binding dehydrogenase [Microthrixaceae bacterium]|nr:zinc-binding dehydrogenase [Microthrixaceae bacterium]